MLKILCKPQIHMLSNSYDHIIIHQGMLFKPSCYSSCSSNITGARGKSQEADVVNVIDYETERDLERITYLITYGG